MLFYRKKIIAFFRTLRVRILTLFLSLFLLSFFLIIGFGYNTNFKARGDLANDMLDIASTSIIENVTDLFARAEAMVNTGVGLAYSSSLISDKNAGLSSYMLNTIRYTPFVPFFYIGTVDGDFLEVANLKLAQATNYRNDPTRPFPPGALYSLEWIDRKSGITSVCCYDQDLNPLGFSQYPSPDYDPRQRPWYKGAEQKKGVYWTDIYSYAEINENGITAARPVLSSSGKLRGICGLDLSISVLQDFLLKQRISPEGKAFILDSSGTVLIPNRSIIADDPPQYLKALDEARKVFQQSGESRHQVGIEKGRYLIYINQFPLEKDTPWLLGLVAPFNDFFGELLHIQKIQFLIVLAILIVAAFIIVYFSKSISAPITVLAGEIDKVCQLDLGPFPPIHSSIYEIHLMKTSIAAMKKAIRSFTVYVPKEIVKHIIHNQQEICIGGQKREITIFFSDIVGFTTLCENYSTDFIMPLITEYFDGLSKLILENGGTIDKYIGDSIMAFWGAPTLQHDHAARGCTVALLCKKFLMEFNRKRREENMPEFITRFGLSKGLVIVGNIGTEERMNYTAVGDAVNIAARLQSLNKTYHTEILITEELYKEIGQQFLARPLGAIQVTGKNEVVNVYELMGKMSADSSIEPTKEDLALCAQFEAAFNAFKAGDFLRAKALFEKLHLEFPQDYITKIFLENLAQKSTEA